MTEDKRDFSFKAYAWRQFKKNKPALFSLYFLLFLVVIAILAPVIANNEPLYVKYKGHSLFPAISFYSYADVTDAEGNIQRLQYDVVDWKKLDVESVIWAPVAYSPGKTDLLNAGYIPPDGDQLYRDENGQIVSLPKKFWHWLGTSKRGEDVLAGLIHGTRISLTIGILSMSIASLLGIFFGSMAGYFGDYRLMVSRGPYWFSIIGVIIAFYYAFQSRSYVISDALSTSGFNIAFQLFISLILLAGITFIFYLVGRLSGIIPFMAERVNIPVDSIISRMIEILISIPNLILIISIAAIAKPSLINLMIIIGFTSWTGIARFTRAEFLRIRSLEYTQAAQALGYSERRIIFKHALPNGLAPAFIAIAFGIAAAILIESSLSFLGIGVPHDVVTWGSLLSAGRENFNAWWLVIFPGLAIFITVTIYNLLGDGLRDALDPRLKK